VRCSSRLRDLLLHTTTFWNGDKPLRTLQSHATHPMSQSGKCGANSDIVRLAMQVRQTDLPGVPQICVFGCSSNATAGNCNDGSAQLRPMLTSGFTGRCDKPGT
jgi:hypothetical protein